MIVLRPDEMRKMDQQTIEDGIPEILLMETAGRGVANKADSILNSNNAQQISIICGKGNNGGDGFAAARFLDMWGYRVKVFLIGQSHELNGVTATNYNICQMRDVEVYYLDQINVSFLQHTFQNSQLIIDAMLGTGLKGEVRGDYGWMIEMINKIKIPVLAVDIPSGIDAKSGKILGQAVKANYTSTMAFYKLGLTLYPGREYAGQVEVIDLGMPQKTISKIDYNHFMLNRKEASAMLPERDVRGHKGTFGRVAVIGGSAGMSGAPAMTGYAALKTGAGLVKVAVPKNSQAIVADYKPELITSRLSEDESGKINRNALANVKKMKEKTDVLVLGPGLGQSNDLSWFIEALLDCVNQPLVIDADGINGLKDTSLLQHRDYPLILTPHPGEMARLINKSVAEILNNRVKITRNFAIKHGVYLILKGASTSIGLPDGRVYINFTGNDGLATAGSGDVLSGILSGLLAQNLTFEDAVVLAPYIHGMAGDKAAFNLTNYSLTATEIINYLPQVWQELKTWSG